MGLDCDRGSTARFVPTRLRGLRDALLRVFTSIFDHDLSPFFCHASLGPDPASHCPNFRLSRQVPTVVSPSHWIKRGVALFLALAY